MMGVRELLKSIGILPREMAGGRREEHRLEELRRTDEKQEEKLTFAENQLEKVKRNQISEEEFWRLLEMWPENGESDESH